MDLEEKENAVDLNNVELCSAVTSGLAKLSVKDEVKMKFRKRFVAVIVKIIEKLKKDAHWISAWCEMLFVYLQLR